MTTPTNHDAALATESDLNSEIQETQTSSSDPQEAEVAVAAEQPAAIPVGQPAATAPSYFFVKRQNLQLPVLPLKSDKPFTAGEEIVALPPTVGSAMEAAFLHMDSVKSPGEPKWLQALSASQKTLYSEEEGAPSLSRQGAAWTQAPNVDNGTPLRGQQLLVSSDAGQILTGDRAVLAALSHFEMGTIFKTPLWNSGFWMSLRATGNVELLEFMRRFTQEKITLGRSTYGLAFSSHMVYTMEAFMELIESSYYNSSLPERPADLASVITIHDFMSLVWGLAAAVYPSGFNYRRSCIAEPSKCNHVVEERAAVPRMLWVDRGILSDEMVRHMRRDKKAGMTMEQITQYQQDLTLRVQSERIISDGKGHDVTVRFRVPTVRSAIDAGSVWVNSISRSVIDALGADSTVDGRNSYMADVAKATEARQHLHWVESITMNGAVINNRESLEKVFDTVFSANDALREDFTAKVVEFSNASAVTVLGIPNYKCPACQRHQHLVEGQDEEALNDLSAEDIPTIIPIEGVTTFFDLLLQKVELIRDRG